MKYLYQLAAVAAAFMLSVSALAEEDKTGFYVAPEVGLLTLQDHCDGLDNSCEDSEIGYGASAGYRFNDFVAAEGGFRFASGFDVDFPHINSQGDDSGLSTLIADADFSTFSLGIRGFAPVSERFAFTTTAGFHFWNLDINVTDYSVSERTSTDENGVSTTTYESRIDASDSGTRKEDGTDPYFGLGGEFSFTDNIAVRAGWTRYIGNDIDADVFSGSVVWSF